MSIEGKLKIRLEDRQGELRCHIQSSRPLHASQLFVNKPIDKLLETLPLLFSICGKAQAITAVRAIESASCQNIASEVEQQRDALIHLESLREHLWHILMKWPELINEMAEPVLLASITQSAQALMQAINAKGDLLKRSPQASVIEKVVIDKWKRVKEDIESAIFAEASQTWLEAHKNVEAWAEKNETLIARCVQHMSQQYARKMGATSVTALNHWDDAELLQRLQEGRYRYTAKPDWQGNPCEVSWFSQMVDQALVAKILQQYGNGLYTRYIARLVTIADLVKKLDDFFCDNHPNKTWRTLRGLAHSDAARGRLSHYVELNGEDIKTFYILAPTEWNFHPRGVAAQSLQKLQATDPQHLEKQAHLMIQAIDPCVGYQLEIRHA